MTAPATDILNQHIDLKIVDRDFALDRAGYAAPITDRESIGQDLQHRIIESGLVLLLIAERDTRRRAQIFNAIIIEVEEDRRLRPGTVQIIAKASKPGVFIITATTLDYGHLKVRLNGGEL